MRALCWIFVLVAASTCVAELARAQDCTPGDEFCLPPPPCYREPDNPDCNPDCTCDSPDYPACDPYCAPGDLCDPNCGNPCFDEFEGDICSDDPDPCVPGPTPPFTFIDNMDGVVDDQIYALGNAAPMVSCGTLTVDTTGYYSIYDTELSESCDDQLDETGYVTIENSCNGDGWAVERNAEERFLVFDSDNTPDCTTDAECGAGKVCRPGTTHGQCCVPDSPVFMGTFLLVAGEPNRICLHHWCPEWRAEIAAGRDFGFVIAGCDGVNSIHFKIGATAIACEDETTLQPCSWGCMDGTCTPDPCDSVSCPAYCMDGVCLDDNPCAMVTCEHGCVRGRCLQNRHARGPDADMDGYGALSDCDDMNAAIHPGRAEVCGNVLDDNCNGFIDEMPCREPGELMDGGIRGDGGTGGTAGGAEGGCACRVAASPSSGTTGALLVVLGLAFLIAGRRRGMDRGRSGRNGGG